MFAPVAIESGAYAVTRGVIPESGIAAGSALRWAVIVAAERHGMRPDDLMARTHRWRVSHARHEAFHLAHKAGLSVGEIGRYFGFDHTTVIHGLRSYARRNGLEATR